MKSLQILVILTLVFLMSGCRNEEVERNFDTQSVQPVQKSQEVKDLEERSFFIENLSGGRRIEGRVFQTSEHQYLWSLNVISTFKNMSKTSFFSFTTRRNDLGELAKLITNKGQEFSVFGVQVKYFDGPVSGSFRNQNNSGEEGFYISGTADMRKIEPVFDFVPAPEFGVQVGRLRETLQSSKGCPQNMYTYAILEKGIYIPGEEGECILLVNRVERDYIMDVYKASIGSAASEQKALKEASKGNFSSLKWKE